MIKCKFRNQICSVIVQKNVVKLENGTNIECEEVVYCTNAWTSHPLPEFHNVIVPVRNNVLSSEPISKLNTNQNGIFN